MPSLRTAAQQALEVMKSADVDPHSSDAVHKAIDALKAALAEPVQDPVAMDWLHKWANQDDGEPETQWHEGYEAARRVVQIHLTATPQCPAEPVQDGCGHCTHPMYCAIKCRVCGRVTSGGSNAKRPNLL